MSHEIFVHTDDTVAPRNTPPSFHEIKGRRIIDKVNSFLDSQTAPVMVTAMEIFGRTRQNMLDHTRVRIGLGSVPPEGRIRIDDDGAVVVPFTRRLEWNDGLYKPAEVQMMSGPFISEQQLGAQMCILTAPNTADLARVYPLDIGAPNLVKLAVGNDWANERIAALVKALKLDSEKAAQLLKQSRT